MVKILICMMLSSAAYFANAKPDQGDFSIPKCERWAYEKNKDWKRAACHHHLGYRWAEKNRPHRYAECESGIKGQEDYADGCKEWIKQNTR